MRLFIELDLLKNTAFQVKGNAGGGLSPARVEEELGGVAAEIRERLTAEPALDSLRAHSYWVRDEQGSIIGSWTLRSDGNWVLPGER